MTLLPYNAIGLILLSVGLWFLSRKLSEIMNNKKKVGQHRFALTLDFSLNFQVDAKKGQRKNSVEAQNQQGFESKVVNLHSEKVSPLNKKKVGQQTLTPTSDSSVNFQVEADKGQKKQRAKNQGVESKVMQLLSKKASQVKIDRTLLEKANSIFDMKLATWKEFTFHDIVKGIKEEGIVKYGETLSKALGLQTSTSTIVSFCEKMKYGHTAKGRVETVQFKGDEFTSVYGFLAHVRNRDGTITVASYLHRLHFKLAPDFSSGTREKFTAVEVHAMKQTFGKHKFLEELRKDGIISDKKESEESENSEESEESENSEESEEETTQGADMATISKSHIDDKLTRGGTIRRRHRVHTRGGSEPKLTTCLSYYVRPTSGAKEQIQKPEAIPDTLMSVLTDRLIEKISHKGPLQLIGMVLSTLAMSEIWMLLGVITNPLTIDPYNIAQIKLKEMKKSIDKSKEKSISEPLSSAIEKLSDVFYLLKEGEQAEAKKLLKTVQAQAQKAKNIDLPFPLHVQAVKIFIFAEIMMLQYDPGEDNKDKTGQPTPCFMPTLKLENYKKEMIHKKLKSAKGDLEEIGQSKKNALIKVISKEKIQKTIGGFLQAQYNIMSICRDFTNPIRMLNQTIQFKMATDFLPFGEDDSTPLPLGLLEKAKEALVSWVWRDPDNAFLRIGMRKFTIQLKHARNMEIQVQLTKTSDGNYYDCHYGEDYKAEAQPENGQLPPKMMKMEELLAEAKHAKSRSTTYDEISNYCINLVAYCCKSFVLINNTVKK